MLVVFNLGTLANGTGQDAQLDDKEECKDGHKDKEGGLVVDYVGIASALKAAMNEYTARDRAKYGDMNIAKIAYPKFKEKLEKILTIPIYLQDERLTTKSATDMLIMGNVSRKDRKKVVDSVAATIILQSYLDRRDK